MARKILLRSPRWQEKFEKKTGSKATGIITKITGISSKFPQNDDDVSNFIQKTHEWTKNRVCRYSFQWNKILSH